MTDSTPAAGEPLFNFARLRIEEATARFDLPWVAPGAHLIVRPANEANKPYQSGLLALAGKRQRLTETVIAGAVTVENARQDREDDRKLYPTTVVVNWGGIFNTKNEPVKPTPDNVAAFFRELPNWILDKVRVFCLRPENFIQPAELPPSASVLAGN